MFIISRNILMMGLSVMFLLYVFGAISFGFHSSSWPPQYKVFTGVILFVAVFMTVIFTGLKVDESL